MVRQRFRPEEIELAVKGTLVQWRNGSHWHDAEVIIDGVQTDSIGSKYIAVKHTGRDTATVSRRTHTSLHMTPGNVRARQE